VQLKAVLWIAQNSQKIFKNIFGGSYSLKAHFITSLSQLEIFSEFSVIQLCMIKHF
jgi:hypothetical protein